MTGQQLKNSILQMAVQGKLVPQDPNDEPASVLVERIRAEKDKFIKEGKIKKEKNPSRIFRGADNLPYEQIGKNDPLCIVDEVPFDIPDSWIWIRFGNLVHFSMGKTPPRKEPEYWSELSYKWVSIADLIADGHVIDTKEGVSSYAAEKTFKNHVSPAGTLLMSFKLTVGKTSILDIDAFHNEAIISIFPYIDDNKAVTNYLFKVLPLISQLGDTKSAIKGATLNSDSIFNLMVPLPPINEQFRIVRKLEEVNPSLRDYTLVEEQSNQLYGSFPDRLKKSILQWAVQGKLVPQDPSDEPASVLLERIREEKERLVKNGKIKKDKNESIIFRRDNSHYEKLNGEDRCIDDEIPFEIPDSWKWSRLKNLVYLTSGGQYPESKGGCLYVKVADMNLSENATEIVTSTRRTESFDIGNIPIYSIIFPKRGGAISTNKKRVVMNEPICIDSNTMSMTVVLPIIFDYLRIWFEGIDLGFLQSGTSVPQINNKDLEPLLVPVPPIEEQSRIVVRIEEALAWTDQL